MNNLLDDQAKSDIFGVEFQELSNGVFTSHIIVWARGLFSRQMFIFLLFSKKTN